MEELLIDGLCGCVEERNKMVIGWQSFERENGRYVCPLLVE